MQEFRKASNAYERSPFPPFTPLFDRAIAVGGLPRVLPDALCDVTFWSRYNKEVRKIGSF